MSAKSKRARGGSSFLLGLVWGIAAGIVAMLVFLQRRADTPYLSTVVPPPTTPDPDQPPADSPL